MNITDLTIEKGVRITQKDALIIVDVQNDFMPGGSLPVKESNLILIDLNAVAEVFKKNKGIVFI